jgi:hypothetical protein
LRSAAAPTANQAIDALQFEARSRAAELSVAASVPAVLHPLSIKIIAIGMVEDAPKPGVRL